MYVLPRGLESLWSVLRARKWVPFVPGGEIIMTRCVTRPLFGRKKLIGSMQRGPGDGDEHIRARAEDAQRTRKECAVPDYWARLDEYRRLSFNRAWCVAFAYVKEGRRRADGRRPPQRWGEGE